VVQSRKTVKKNEQESSEVIKPVKEKKTRKTKKAVERNIEIIGEAVNRIMN
jgi:uncharacterized protein with HEPN domain